MRRLVVALAMVVALSGCAPLLVFGGVAREVHDQREGDVQDQLDVGRVVDVFGCVGRSPDLTGCRPWLAGHRSTHGSPFAGVPSLRAGDEVIVVSSVGPVVYRVVRTAVWSSLSDAMWWSIGADVVLQTSWYGGSRWFVFLVRA